MKRYSLHTGPNWYDMKDNPTGAWVKFDDAWPRIAKAQAKLHAAREEARRLKGTIAVLEQARPHWAQGWTDDSVAAQASSAALSALWEMLGVSNQTQAVMKLREILK